MNPFGMYGNMGSNPLMQNYELLPEYDMMSDDPGLAEVLQQTAYDTIRDLSTFNPAMEGVGAGVGAIAGMPWLGKLTRPIGRAIGRFGDEAMGMGGQMLRKMRGSGDEFAQHMGARPPVQGQQMLSDPAAALPNPGAGPMGPMGPDVGRQGLPGAEMASGHPTLPMSQPPPGADFRAMDEMAPLGGGAPPMDMPNQAYNDIVEEMYQPSPDGYPDGMSMEDWYGSQGSASPEDFGMYPDPGGVEGAALGVQRSADNLQDFDRWSSANLGPDDFANRDDWMRHQDYMQQGPTPGPMNFVASSADPAQLIQQSALEMIQQGVPPAEAIQAATMQFSDLLR